RSTSTASASTWRASSSKRTRARRATPRSPTTSPTLSPEEIRRLRAECRRNPARFNRRVLGRPAYWWRQAQIAESVRDYPVTLVPAGNMVGKSFVAAGIVLDFLCHHPNCLVLCTAPSQVQLEEVLWKEVERAYKGARVPLGG